MQASSDWPAAASASPPACGYDAGVKQPVAPFQIFSQLHKASRQITLLMDERCRADGLSSGEAHLLGYCAGYGPCPIGELHRVFGVQRSTLTSVLDRLSERRWIERSPNPQDRRSQLISVTAEGKDLALRMRSLHLALEQEIVSQLSQSDLLAFQRVMETIGEVTGVQVRAAR